MKNTEKCVSGHRGLETSLLIRYRRTIISEIKVGDWTEMSQNGRVCTWGMHPYVGLRRRDSSTVKENKSLGDLDSQALWVPSAHNNTAIAIVDCPCTSFGLDKAAK